VPTDQQLVTHSAEFQRLFNRRISKAQLFINHISLTVYYINKF